MSANKKKQLDDEIEYMLKNYITEPSFSSWASPSLLVNKPDGSFRFCTDYRKVNAITKPDSFPLPRIEDCVDQVGNARFVSKFDLLKGYWQVPLTARAREVSDSHYKKRANAISWNGGVLPLFLQEFFYSGNAPDKFVARRSRFLLDTNVSASF